MEAILFRLGLFIAYFIFALVVSKILKRNYGYKRLIISALCGLLIFELIMLVFNNNG